MTIKHGSNDDHPVTMREVDIKPIDQTNLFLGIDSDTTTMPYAWVSADGKLQAVIMYCLKDKKVNMPAMARALINGPAPYGNARTKMAAVEDQAIRPGDPRPNDILHLAQAAAMALLHATVLSEQVLFPLPVQWKGSVDPLVLSKRILVKAGFPLDQLGVAGGKEPYAYPLSLPFGLNKRDWLHAADAIGLAQYAAEQYAYTKRKSELFGVTQQQNN